jgi:glycosyltransferase involved in cell wall biosynthesis
MAGRHWLERWASWSRPELVLANSRVTLTAAERLFPGVRGEVLYLPVEAPALIRCEITRREVRRELGCPDQALVIVTACRLEPWKGHAVLLEAVGRLADLPGWECWIVGGVQRPQERCYLEHLRSLSERLGLAARARFLGQRHDVPRLLAAADIYCQPNTGPEPFGLAFVEALHAGLPVVATALGGAVEVVDSTCGVLVRPGDAADLATALGRLLADDDRRSRLGAAGPGRAARLCDPAERLGQLAVLLRQAHSGRDSTP